MTNRERRIFQRLKDDFPHYASRCLQVQPKEGGSVPFQLNFAQRTVHEALERQRAETGMVRAIILKARKEGVSTLIGGRFFHRVTHHRGLRAKVMTHHQESTGELFEMVRRFYDNCPAPVRPHAERNSVREIYFDNLDSFYGVATAGGREVGRGGTPHLFHGSEVGLWPNADMHVAGVLESIPDAVGTEIILESTGRGVGTVFHQRWQAAEARRGGYLPIFLPWYIDPSYRDDPGPDFDPTGEELEMATQFGLDWGQLAWRRRKIINLGAEWRFKQEFPATPSEAFQAGNEDPLITPDLADRALRRLVLSVGGIVVAVDPARMGKDRTGIVVLQGRRVLRLVVVEKRDTMAVVGLVKTLMEEFGAWRAFVDSIGIGAGVYDRLLELNMPVTEVKAGDEALDPEHFVNIRAQMWDMTREWLVDGSIPADDPHAAELVADLCAPKYSFDSKGRKRLESKQDMKKRGIRSPDLGDALAIGIIGPLIYHGESLGVVAF